MSSFDINCVNSYSYIEEGKNVKSGTNKSISCKLVIQKSIKIKHYIILGGKRK